MEGAGASELTEDMCRLVEKYKKLCKEEQWSMNKNTGCFLAGTKVSTPEGMRNIEEIMVGEEVYAENTATGKSEKRKVTRISQQKTNIIVYLQVNGSEICSTMEHSFRHKEKGWVKAEELLPGDFLKQRDGEYAEITYIRQRKEEKEQWVYNLEVEGLHSYYVAGEKLLVHNGEGVCPSGNVKIESAGKSGKSSVIHNDIIDNYAGYATKTSLKNAIFYQLEGSLNGVSGRFEWIIQDGKVTHRMFVQNGTMNGVPIKP